MRKDNERGAIVVEATISLTTFIFLIFTILSIVNIYFIQAKISVALNSAAKEISQYSYLYYKLNVDQLEANANKGTGTARSTAEQTIDGVGALIDSISDGKSSVETYDFDALIENVNSGTKSVDSLVTLYGENLADDPKGFILGMGKMAVNDLGQTAKKILGQSIAKAFMQKNLKAFKDDDPNDFLRRYRVVDEMAGLDFSYTTLMAYGESNKIQLVVTYDVQVIKFLNIDFKFKFRQVSQAAAWGNGVSSNTKVSNKTQDESKDKKNNTESVWDNPSATERGKIIVSQEKAKYKYTDSGHGFDAYNNLNGANEFITVFSINTHNDSYSTSNGIKNRLSAEYSKLVKGVENLDETITVKNQDGETVKVESDKETRTYKIVLVVPDDADMEIVNKAVEDFKNSVGEDVVVEVRTGYGSPS